MEYVKIDTEYAKLVDHFKQKEKDSLKVGNLTPTVGHSTEVDDFDHKVEDPSGKAIGINMLYRLTKRALSKSLPMEDRLDAIKTLDYQTSTHYVILRSIFMPNLGGDNGSYINAPDRWEEPQVEELLYNFSRLTLRGREIINSGLGSDLVYSGIFNPEIRKKIEERKGLTEKEYQRIENALNKLPESVARQVPTTTTSAIQPYEVGQLAVPFHITQENRFNEISNELLTIETGLSLRVVRGFKDQGFSGSEIVDAKLVMSDQGTNTQVIRTLKRYGIDLEHSEILFDISKEYKVSMTDLAKKVSIDLNGDVEELERVVDEFGGEIHRIADQRGMNEWQAFQRVFEVYTGRGNRDIDKTSDVLQNRGRRLSLNDHPSDDDDPLDSIVSEDFR